MDTPLKTVFYSIERTIKEYRKFAQRNLNQVSKDITVDQALILMILEKDASLSQRQLAVLLFRDNAAITRTIQLMVKNGFIRQETSKTDRRQMRLILTKKGSDLLSEIRPVILQNRRHATENINETEINSLVSTLDKIYGNCLVSPRED